MRDPTDLLADLKRQERKHGTVYGILFALGFATLFFAMYGRLTFPFTFTVIVSCALFAIGFTFAKRNPYVIRRWTTAEIIAVLQLKEVNRRIALGAELCDRATSKDQMAKAFLKGESWENQPESGPLTQEQRLRLDRGQKKLRERVVVYDAKHGFRTAFGLSSKAQTLIIGIAVGLVVIGAPFDDYAAFIKPTNPKLSYLINLPVTFAVHFPLLGTLIFLNLLKEKRGILFELSTRQVLSVYIHRQCGLRAQAAAILRERAERDPSAEGALSRLGLREEPRTRGPITTPS